MMRIVFLALGLFFCISRLFSQPVIEIRVDKMQSNTLIVGMVKNNQSEILDTLFRASDQIPFIYKSKIKLGERILYVRKPNERIEWQFMYKDSDPDFKIFIGPSNKANIGFENHQENKEFYNHLNKILILSNQLNDSLAFSIIADSIKSVNHVKLLTKALDEAFYTIRQRPNASYYFINQLLPLFAISVSGYDKAYIHLIENYVTKKIYPFTEDEKKKFLSQSNDFKILIEGNQMPDFTLFDVNGKDVSLYKVKAEHIILMFWSPTCQKCKNSIPYLVDFMENNKARDVKILTVCDKGGDQIATCWPVVKDNKMNQLINGVDPNRLYNQKLRMRKVPKIFILDRNKKILYKDFNIPDIGKFFKT